MNILHLCLRGRRPDGPACSSTSGSTSPAYLAGASCAASALRRCRSARCRLRSAPTAGRDEHTDTTRPMLALAGRLLLPLRRARGRLRRLDPHLRRGDRFRRPSPPPGSPPRSGSGSPVGRLAVECPRATRVRPKIDARSPPCWLGRPGRRRARRRRRKRSAAVWIGAVLMGLATAHLSSRRCSPISNGGSA